MWGLSNYHHYYLSIGAKYQKKKNWKQPQKYNEQTISELHTNKLQFNNAREIGENLIVCALSGKRATSSNPYYNKKRPQNAAWTFSEYNAKWTEEQTIYGCLFHSIWCVAGAVGKIVVRKYN